MDESNRLKRAESREFWQEAVRLWIQSGLSVREFCSREGLAEHTFYVKRREFLPEVSTPEIQQESRIANGDAMLATGPRRRKRRQRAVADASAAPMAASFVELAAPTPANLCHCTIELHKSEGATMRIQLRSDAMPDLAAVSRSFWNHC